MSLGQSLRLRPDISSAQFFLRVLAVNSYWRPVGSALSQSAKYCLVELRVCTARKEAIQLVEDREVGIVALWPCTVTRLHMVLVQIDLF